MEGLAQGARPLLRSSVVPFACSTNKQQGAHCAYERCPHLHHATPPPPPRGGVGPRCIVGSNRIKKGIHFAPRRTLAPSSGKSWFSLAQKMMFPCHHIKRHSKLITACMKNGMATIPYGNYFGYAPRNRHSNASCASYRPLAWVL